ncbi:hypothetical protein Prum_040630 [Phytohabitans rumicis]|uniref:Uncharacterized protein n=1 Tax=Phytohabitans rumicis TaxID=1076125 RepID=A0A6V8L6H7_9ACTN|nr:hypothetical protein Prum_040630 [Phytohabitans rumicis]
MFASSIGAVAGCLSLERGGSGANLGAGATETFGTPTVTASASPSAEATAAEPETPRTTKPAPRRTTRAPETGPKIEYFKITQWPKCPQGTSEYPVEGVPVKLEWKVTGAHEVTISVDGDGVYKTYETEGWDEIYFPCGDGQPGEEVTHTYKLKTVGGGDVKSKTLSASAEVYEVATV